MTTSHKGKKTNPKKGKSLIKLINKSDSETDESEHELSYYLDDRVKLMKEVLKIIKPKKIKSMAPKWMRSLDMEEINSMLFEELLGISNKRLKGIFIGQTQEEDSSSTDPEEENEPIDIISLDDITDDEFINLDSDEGSTSKKKKTDKIKVKQESKKKKVKKEKRDKSPKKSQYPDKEKTDEQNLMSVLELLELQARARAIRSQLALESQKKAELVANSKTTEPTSDNEDAVIIEIPKNVEIVITSSESENEQTEESTSKNNINHRRENNEVTQNNTNNQQSVRNSEKDINFFDTQITENNSLDTEGNNDNLKDDSIETVSETSNDPEAPINKSSESSKILDELNTSIRDDGINEVQDVAASSSELNISNNAQDTSRAQNKIQIHKISIFRKGQMPNENVSMIAQEENDTVIQQITTDVSDTNDKDLIKEKRKSDIAEVIDVCKEPPTNKENGDEMKSKSTACEENLQQTHDDAINSEQVSSEPKTGDTFNKIQIRKIRIFRKRKKSVASESISESEAALKPKIAITEKSSEKQKGTKETAVDSVNIEENDGIVINVDQAEIECISD